MIVQVDLWEVVKVLLPVVGSVLGCLAWIIRHLYKFLTTLDAMETHLTSIGARMEAIESAIKLEASDVRALEREQAKLRTEVVGQIADRPTRDELGRLVAAFVAHPA